MYPVWFATDRKPNDKNDLTKGFSAERASDDKAVFLAYVRCYPEIAQIWVNLDQVGGSGFSPSTMIESA